MRFKIILWNESSSSRNCQSTRSSWKHLMKIMDLKLCSQELQDTNRLFLEMASILLANLRLHSSAKFRTWNVSRLLTVTDYLQSIFQRSIWIELEPSRMVLVNISVMILSKWEEHPSFIEPKDRTWWLINPIPCLRILFSVLHLKCRIFGTRQTHLDLWWERWIPVSVRNMTNQESIKCN